jgi:predicted glycoside hydrolase/deacetylase ChbG (UPF0249 family)
MVQVIINADDIGMTPGVTRGIVESMLNGIVTSSTFMASMPDAENGAEQVAAHGLNVGVHLNLTNGRPLMPAEAVPSIVTKGGEFLSNGELHARFREGKASLEEIELECNRQVERTIELGIRPTHVDTHHHMHSWFPLAKVIKRVAARHGIRKIRTLRTADVYFGGTAAGNSREDQRARRRKRYDGFKLTLGGFRTPLALMKRGAFEMPENRSTGRRYHDEWIYLIEKLGELGRPGVYEIPCHPAYSDAALANLSNWSNSREAELAALTSDEVKDAVARSGIQLISYAEL